MGRHNPRRRWLERQRALQERNLAQLTEDVICGRDTDDSSLLQRGSPRFNSNMYLNRHSTLSSPRQLWEGSGKPGKVQGGKLKPKRPHEVKRFDGCVAKHYNIETRKEEDHGED